ncbi:MAG: O-antigen ligase family protein, partial [Candidatus Omnitrophica bacterium]|nr:O-antigen ligase family protein [Candidatus Omnitrophota bacterium]
MKKEIYKGFIWLGMAVVIIFTPLARGGMTVWAVMSALSIVYLLIFAWLVKSTHKFQSTAIDIPLLLLAILAVISFAFSIYKYASFNALLSLFAFIGIYYLIVNNFDKVMVRRLITLVICLGTGLSIYGLLQYFGYLDHSWWRHDNFLTASYINHNHFAGLLELVIPVSFAMLLTRRRKKAVVIVSALIIMITAFVFAQSRGAWLSLGVSLFVMTVILVNKKIIPMRSIFIFLIVVTLLISFAYFNGGFVSERIDSIGDIVKGKDSLFMRLKIWDGTTNLILHNPLIGTGIGTFVWALPGYRPEGLNV